MSNSSYAPNHSFPKWAPAELVDVFHTEKNPHFKKILHRLLAHEDMKGVWELRGVEPTLLVRIIFECIKLGDQRLPSQEYRKKLRDIIKQSERLRSDLEEFFPLLLGEIHVGRVSGHSNPDEDQENSPTFIEALKLLEEISAPKEFHKSIGMERFSLKQELTITLHNLYFMRTHKNPMHSFNAKIVSTLTGEHTDEESVKQMIFRARKNQKVT